MNVLLCGDFDPGEEAAWRSALQAAARELGDRLPPVHWWDLSQARAAPDLVEVAVVANPPPGSLQGLPALRLVQSLWAGVDRLLRDPTLPPGVPLARMVDPAMTAAMVQTAVWAVLSLHRGFFAYARRQRAGQWQPHGQRRADETPVLVLGEGELGRAAGAALRALGYPVSHWRRQGDAGLARQQLARRLGDSRIVVNLLPLTPDTAGLLDAAFFGALPRGAGLVNLARGAHLVEADLLSALDRGQLRDAVLDVFATEPLPAGHPFWSHPRVTVLPHAAAMTDPRTAAGVVVANLAALAQGRPPAFLVDRGRGY